MIQFQGVIFLIIDCMVALKNCPLQYLPVGLLGPELVLFMVSPFDKNDIQGTLIPRCSLLMVGWT